MFEIGNPSKLRHGHAKRGTQSPEYRCWQAMKRRCVDPNRSKFEYYGGAGVTVSPLWLDDFERFLADVGPRPSLTHSLDRYPNPAGNYEPGNVRWATKQQQMENRKNTRTISVDGENIALSTFCQSKGLELNIIANRLDLGWPLDRAVSQPILRRNYGPRS